MREIDAEQPVDLDRVLTQPKTLSPNSFARSSDLDPVTALIDEVVKRTDPLS